MQTKVIETYGIEELEGRAKENALEWLREGLDYEWYDSVFEDAKKCASILGIEIGDIYFSMDDGACFNGKFTYAKGWKKALKKYAPIDTELLRMGQELQKIQKPFLYQIGGTVGSNGRYHTTICGSADINGRFADVPDSTIDDLSQVFTDFASWIFSQLRTEYEWLTSEECLIENAQSNGADLIEKHGVDYVRNVLDNAPKLEPKS